jgi:tetratricopeptide (TPR) repeat protein
MTVELLLGEAKMLRKMWRYKEALSSYEEVLERAPDCIAAHYGKCKMLRASSRRKEALLAYEELLQLDPASARASIGKTVTRVGQVNCRPSMWVGQFSPLKWVKSSAHATFW